MVKSFVHFRKGIFLAFVLLLKNALCVFAQDYLVKLPQNSEHYVIDDNVNVRSEPNPNGKKLFKLNTGDKVVILSKSLADYDFYRISEDEWEKAKAEAESEPYLLTEGLWSPWYKIRCDKGEGYICGRHVSCKELKLDADCDGKGEVLACLTTSKIKGMLHYSGERWNTSSPCHDYLEQSRANKDIKHVLIKGKKAVPIDFPDSTALKRGFVGYYELDDSRNFSPPVCVLIITSAVGLPGDSKLTGEYYYFAQNKFLPIFSYEWRENEHSHFAVECKENCIIYEFYESVPYYSKNNLRHQTIEDSETYYTWDGRSFSKEKKERELEYSREYLEWLENSK